MGFCTILSSRLPPLSCAILATASLFLSLGASTTCRFLNIRYPAHTPTEDGFIIADESFFNNRNITDDSFDKHHVGIFCESEYFNRDGDLMWILTRYSIIISFCLLGITLLTAWGLATFVKPTFRNWKILSVVSIVTAGIQIPSFLFYTIQPCQTNQASCSADEGFFMLLWSIILMTTITIVTQCFNYPAWREDMERWKIQEREYPLYDQEDTFDIEEEQNYNMQVIHGQMLRNGNGHGNQNSPLREKSRARARYENKVFPTQELNPHRLLRKIGKKAKSTKAKDGAFNYDDMDKGSQCLSGMSAETPSVYNNRNGLASLLKEEASDDDNDGDTSNDNSQMMIFSDVDAADEEEMKMEVELSMQDVYNVEWGECARNGARNGDRRKDEEQGLPVKNSSPFCSPPRSPPRRRLKKGKENVSYVGLEDDDGDDDESQDLENGNDHAYPEEKYSHRNDNDSGSFHENEIQDLEYGNDHASRRQSYKSKSRSRNNSSTFHDVDMSDVESMNSSHFGKQLQVVDLATGTRELIVENVKRSTSTLKIQTETIPTQSLLVPMVSDDEEEDPDLSYASAMEDHVGSNAIMNYLENGEKRTNLNHYQPSSKNTDSLRFGSAGALAESEDEGTEDDDVVSPSDKHLATLLAKFIDADGKYQSLNEDIASEKSSEWHDVLDDYGEDEPRQRLIQSRSEDFDNEKDHVEMMKTLRQRRPEVFKSSTGMDVSPITRRKNSSVDQHTSSTGTRTGFVSHVVVSDNEDEVGSLGEKGTVRHLYPDEVEV